jgi:hypothetical protein
MMRSTTRVGLFALAALAVGVAVSVENAPPAAEDTVSSGPAAARPPAARPGRMHSLSVPSAGAEAQGAPREAFAPFVDTRRTSPVSAVQIGSGTAGRQSMTLRGSSGTFMQRQDGAGNTQILNAESASAGAVRQRQSGSGNFQSMNIGVTDRRSDVVSGISIE